MTTGQRTKLRRPRKEVEERLRRQIFEGQLLEVKSVAAPDQLRFEARAWLDYNIQLLPDLFTTDEILRSYIGPVIVKTDFDLFSDQYQREVEDLKDEIRDKLPRLNSILKRLDFFQEETASPATTQPSSHTNTAPSPQIIQAAPTSSSTKESRADAWLFKLKNHPLVATIVLVGAIISGLASFTDSLTKISTLFISERKSEVEPVPSSPARKPTPTGPQPDHLSDSPSHSVERGGPIHSSPTSMPSESQKEIRSMLETAKRIFSTVGRDDELNKLALKAANEKEFDLAIEIATNINSTVGRDNSLETIFQRAITARDFPTADRTIKHIYSTTRRDNLLKQIISARANESTSMRQ